MKKKLSVILFTFVLVIAMATPCFAATQSTVSNFSLKFAISEGASTNCNMNVYGNDTVSAGRNVCMWSASNTLSQKWNHLPTMNADGNYRIQTRINGEYFLNAYRVKNSAGYWNCTMEKATGNLTDTAIIWVGNYIYLKNYTSWNLAIMGDYNNADVRWVPVSDHTHLARTVIS